MKENKLRDGNIKELLISMSIPAILGQLVTLIYSMVDRMFIGHMEEVGGLALTGVGLTAPLVIIISAFAVLIGMGGAPRASIKMGEDDYGEAEKILGNSFHLLILIALGLTVFFTGFSERLLLAFGASPATLPYAMDYMRIYTWGIIFVQLSLGLNPFISSQGFVKVSMFSVLIGALTNIVLDPIFIYLLDMGVKGAALATILSQALSSYFIVRFLRGDKTNLKIRRPNLALEARLVKPIILLGLSPFVMQFTESLIIVAFNANLQRFGGDAAVGAMTILSSAMQFVFLPLSGLTQGAQPLMSYNYGAKNEKRMEETFRLLFIACVTYSTVFWLFIMVFPGLFARGFTSNEEIIEIAKYGLRIYMAGTFALGVQVACQQTFIAMGNAKTSLFLALLRKVFLLIPLIYILPGLMENKLMAVFLAEALSDLIAATVTGLMFKANFRKTLDGLAQEERLDQVGA